MKNKNNKYKYLAGGLSTEATLALDPAGGVPLIGGLDMPRLRNELVACLYYAVPLSLLVNLVCSTALLAMLIDQGMSEIRLGGWYLAVWAMVLMRWSLYRNYQAREVPAGEDDVWGRYAVLAAAATGMLWGLLPVILWPAGAPIYQAAELVVVGGMAAGGAISLAPLMPAALVFLTTALLPMIARLLFENQVPYGYLAVLAVLYLVVVATTTRRLNLLVSHSFVTRYHREQAEARIKEQAFQDELTGLANRRLFSTHLQQEFARARRQHYPLAVHFLNLDNFKTINDSLGHAVGDRLLKAVAGRLQERLRDEDLVARLGGDEFVILQTGLQGDKALAVHRVEMLADDVRRLLCEPFRIQGHELHLTVSIGVAMFPEDGQTPEEVLQHADAAMYKAKEQGHGSVQFFLPEMQDTAMRRLRLVKELREAIRDDRLAMHYQPQTEADGRLVGLEALLRWEHPERGFISPAEFVPLAEESGLIYELHDWVQAQVCADIRQLQDRVGVVACPVVSMNVSPREFRRSGLLDSLKAALARSGIAPQLLKLEITEGAAMDDVEQVIPRMEAIRELGISFSIDDFGTGYSSLGYLKRLPVDALKIDRSFIRDILEDSNDRVLVTTVIGMARQLGLRTVAEGVEDVWTRDFLEAHGCDLYQGWLFGRPVSLADILPVVEAGSVFPEA